MRLLRLLFVFACCGGWLAEPGHATPASVTFLAGIVEGSVVVLRQSQRYGLPEGASLQPEDIVETGPGAFVQLELADGMLVGVGENSRLMLSPRVAAARAGGALRFYVLEGWVKVTPSPSSSSRVPAGGEDVYLAPSAEIAGKAAVSVAHLERSAWAVFVESGAVRVSERSSGRTPWLLKANEFGSQRAGAKPVVASRPPADFVAQMPRWFRDALPSRADLYAGRKVAPKLLGEVSYDDVSAWLHAEAAVRQPLLLRWRARASDKAFRAAVQANLAAHPEWEPVVYPERFIKRPAEPASPASLSGGAQHEAR